MVGENGGPSKLREARAGRVVCFLGMNTWGLILRSTDHRGWSISYESDDTGDQYWQDLG